jgi:carbon storage regulator
MLILTRRVGEGFKIGDHVRVVLLEIDRGKARLGIDAPRDIPVFRDELLTTDPVTGLTCLPNSSSTESV